MAIVVVGVDETKKRRVTCKRCCSILEYALVDIKTEVVSCMGDSECICYIPCPSCSEHIEVKRY